ncbi:MAG: orotidine-5'-phosphate decarboxylase [Bernardetiaceae bacterium]
MLNYKMLVTRIRSRKSFLCVGLDTDPQRLPDCLKGSPDPVLAFNKAIIAATADYCVAFKINTAFYEAQGAAGWQTLTETVAAIPETHLCILDAKRGDIGNTAQQYAQAFWQMPRADALTLSPYMGKDTVMPFLEAQSRWAILLALTSNPGSADFQLQKLASGDYLYEEVVRQATAWADHQRLMFVVGATHPEHIERVRRLAPRHFLLIPGVGAQGGDLERVFAVGQTNEVGLLVNASRSIIYASLLSDFDMAAAEAAARLQNTMQNLLS